MASEPDRPDIDTVLASARAPKWRRPVLVAGLIVASLALAAWYWTGRTSQGDAIAYITAPITRGDLVVTVTATGTVEPTNLVEISSELSGTVREVLVDNNDRVAVGQVLARLDTEKLEATLAQGNATLEAREARVAEADATVEESRAQNDRIMTLVDRNVASIQELQTAEAAYARAKAAAAVARADAKVAAADLTIDETNLKKACICSPIDGIILSRDIDVGQIVASSLQAPVLFTIAEDLSKMELRVDIDEADVGSVQVGQQAKFTVEAYQGRSFPAEIAELRFAPQTVDGVVTYKAILSIDNSDRLLRPGMTATAEITVNEIAEALLVPNAAFRFAPPETDQGGESGSGLLGLLIPKPPSSGTTTPPPADTEGRRTLWILRDGRADPVKVLPGATDGLNTAVPDDGLEAGDQVIVDLAAG